MDREVKELYQVLIQAKDMGGQLGGLAGTATINITLSDVNDNPPRFSKSKAFHYYIFLKLFSEAIISELKQFSQWTEMYRYNVI